MRMSCISLYLKGGVIDGLIRDNIVVTTEQSKEIQFVCIAGRMTVD